MIGTAGDYLRFLEALRKGGEGVLRPETAALVTTDAIDAAMPTDEPGWGFGFGAAVLRDPAAAKTPQTAGTWSWGGAWGTVFWIDPVEELIPIMLIQITSYSHFNIRPLFSVISSQAVVDSLADQKPRVLGYDTPK